MTFGEAVSAGPLIVNGNGLLAAVGPMISGHGDAVVSDLEDAETVAVCGLKADVDVMP